MQPVPIAFVLFTSASVPADEVSPPARSEPGPAPIPTDVQQLRDQWMRCTASVAKPYLRSHRPAATVADVAMQRCKAQERPCCGDQGWGRNDPDPVLGSCDADGLRASQV